MDVFQQDGFYAEVDGFLVLNFQYEDHWTVCLEPWHEEERCDERVSREDWYANTKRAIKNVQPNFSTVPTLFCAECEAPVWHDYLCGACRVKEQ
jgi:hypothetical protein